MDQLFNFIPDWLGLDPATFTLLLIIISTVANVISKVIPESATGWQGVVRKIASIIGISVANRITPLITSTDVAKAVAAGVPDPVVKQAAAELPQAVETGHGTNALAVAIVESGIPDARVEPPLDGPIEPAGGPFGSGFGGR